MTTMISLGGGSEPTCIYVRVDVVLSGIVLGAAPDVFCLRVLEMHGR